MDLYRRERVGLSPAAGLVPPLVKDELPLVDAHASNPLAVMHQRTGCNVQLAVLLWRLWWLLLLLLPRFSHGPATLRHRRWTPCCRLPGTPP